MNRLKETIKGTPIARFARPVVHALRRKWNTLNWRFERDLVAHLAAQPLDALEASSTRSIRDLGHDGFVVLEQVHDSATIEAVRTPLIEFLERVRRGERDPAWDVVAYPADGIYRVRRIRETFPAAAPLLMHPKVLEHVRAYVGERWRYTAYADYKPDLIHDYTSVPHTDTWRRQLKAFTLLVDVGPDNAPFVYWAGSHRDGAWRRRFDYLLWSNDYIGSGGVYPPHVLRDLAEKGELREAEVTGRAGDVIVASTRGPHRASNLRSGYRLQLVEVFDPE
jgi:hypothetical protein